MTTIIGISGSLRRGSFNTALLHAAVDSMPDGARLETGSIRKIPLYNGDIEKNEGIPAAVETLKEQIVSAHGLLLVTPEYNNAMPGVLKNAIDWLTRPPADTKKVFSGLPVALMGATPGHWGTLHAQRAFLPILRTLGTAPFFGRVMYVPEAKDSFSDDGRLADEKLEERLKAYLAAFVDFVRERRPG